MGTAERRNAILKALCRRRYETIGNLAAEFEVSERTIRRDIEVLSYTEPIYTQTGRCCGGVYVVDGYSVDRMYMTDEEICILTKMLHNANRESLLTPRENDLVKGLIENYTKPVPHTQKTDPRGNVTSYDVDATTSRITTVTDRCGNKTGYEYDACGRTTKVTAKDANGVALSDVSYSYDSLDNLAEITRGDGMGYGMQYDAFHELESIGITGKDEKLVTYGYNSGHGRLKTVTYANGDTMKVAYNSQGQLVSEKWYDAVNVLTASYRYVYDSQGTVIRSIDILNLKEYNYSYDEGRLLRAVECTITLDEYENVISKTTVNEIRYSYDTDGSMTGRRLVLEGGRELPVRQEASDSENRTVYFAGTSEIVSHSQTDGLGRKAVDGIRFNSLDLYRQFSYHAGQITQAHIDNEKQQSGATTRLVSLITLYGGRTIAYEYDGEERITKVTDSRNGITEYTYDALGQLLTETVNGTVVNTMTYDNYGNILTKNGKTYTYGNAVWKDLLVAYDGQGIFYDAQGNPVSYLGHTLTWEKGRQLKSFDNITYTYNANGIRTSKRVQGIKHTYALDGSKILQETWANNNIVPLYDTDDAVCGMIYNGSPYFFQKNLQGDVIGITNVSGTIVARYSYDAWGACTILSDITNGVATVNPFRYRGYYFDTETNLYYLQSRYYDPRTGRFLSSDGSEILTLDPDVLAENLYSYCYNRPVNESDYNGALIGKVLKKILVGILKGFIKQFCVDLIEWAFVRFIRGIKKSFAPSSAEDYISTALSEIVDQFSFSQIVGLAASAVCLLIKYLPKLLGGRMENKDWWNLLVDITAIFISSILGNIQKKLKNKRDQLIRKSFKTEWSKVYTSSLNKVRIKIQRYGFVLDFSIPISQQLVSSAINIIFAG